MISPTYWSAQENTTEDRQYGISWVWVNPNQIMASTMEEAVEMLAACPSSGIDWPYTLAQLYEGSHHTPLPKNKHLGIQLLPLAPK